MNTTSAMLGRAALGPLAMALALGIGTAVGQLHGGGSFADRLLPAAVTCLIAVPVVFWFWLRRGGLHSIGLTADGRGFRGFVLGFFVTSGSAMLVLGAATAAGWLRWGPFDAAGLGTFLLTNAVVALLMEALPEELALRGHAWSLLRSQFGVLLSALGTTVMFLLVPVLSMLIAAAITAVFGGPSVAIGLAPGGQDPVSYLLLLTVFSATLIAARGAFSSLWTSIATHLSFLTVQRIAFEGGQRGAGWSAELTTPDAELLVPVYLLLAAIAFLAIRRVRQDARAQTETPVGS